MRNANNNWLWALAGLLLLLFAWGAEQVAVMPLQTGEVYPYYSSLRSDPLGTRALYQSLASLPEIEVSRLYKVRPLLEPQTTLLILGVDPSPWYRFLPEQSWTDYERMVSRGGRLVIAFLPVNSIARPPDSTAASADEPKRLVAMKDRWGAALVFHKPGRVDEAAAVPRASAVTLEAGPGWRVLETRGGLPTAAERSFGTGTVVLLTDSYPLSNEGLRDARNPELIARLLGNGREIVFDEQHLGVGDQDGVAALVRKYRLEGSLAVLLVAVALFMWSSATSFLPPRVERLEDAVAGRDSQEGMATLLRRGIPEKDLLDTCFREWTRSAPAARVAQAVEAEIAPRREREPVDVYRAVQQVIAEKR